MRVTFRRKRPTFGSDPESYAVSVDGREVGAVSAMRGGGWFWWARLGDHARENTAARPVASQEEARAACRAWLLARRRMAEGGVARG